MQVGQRPRCRWRAVAGRVASALRKAAIAALTIGPAIALIPQGATGENVLIVVADDLGVDKVGLYGFTSPSGQPLAGDTPTLDQLAARGVTFRNAWANPSCSPTRATCMTGLYASRTGLGRILTANPVHLGLSTRFTALPEAVDPLVRTAAIGKWHLAGSSSCAFPSSCTGSGWHPVYTGFELHAGTFANIRPFAGWSYDLWPKVQSADGGRLIRSLSTVYATTDTTNDAIRTIETFGDAPWMIWLAYNAPHKPFHDPPAPLYDGPPSTSFSEQVRAMTEGLDYELGRLLVSMDPEVLDRTTILFFGDNGTAAAAVDLPFTSDKAKGSLYNGGVNVPFLVAGPRVDPSAYGQMCDALVNTTDVFATTIDICGGDGSTGTDSVSVLPYLTDPDRPSLRDYVIAEKFVRNFVPPATPTGYRIAIRNQRYKLIQIEGERDELYDLFGDFHEETNLLAGALNPSESAAYAELVARVNSL